LKDAFGLEMWERLRDPKSVAEALEVSPLEADSFVSLWLGICRQWLDFWHWRSAPYRMPHTQLNVERMDPDTAAMLLQASGIPASVAFELKDAFGLEMWERLRDPKSVAEALEVTVLEADFVVKVWVSALKLNSRISN